MERVKFLDFAQFLTKFLSHASIGVDVEAASMLSGCNAVITYGVNFPHHRRTPTDGIEIKYQGAVKTSHPFLFRRSMEPLLQLQFTIGENIPGQLYRHLPSSN